LRLSARDYDKAVQDGHRFIDKFPKDSASDDVYFLVGRAHEAQGKHADAAATYREFLKRSKNADRRVEAYTRLGQVYLATGDRKAADGAFGSAVSDARKQKKKLEQGRYYAAQARYLQGDEALRDFDSVKIEGDVRGLSGRLKAKSKLLGRAASIYADVVGFEVAEWVTAALYKIGQTYERFAKALNDAPVPERLSEQEQQVYRDELSMFVVPIEERALEAYEGGYKKARELGIYNKWTVLMREGLTRMNEVEYPPIRELGGEIAYDSPVAQGPVLKGLQRRTPAAPAGKPATPGKKPGAPAASSKKSHKGAKQ
jgi:tetratricopeptide (TPR) repeat protein